MATDIHVMNADGSGLTRLTYEFWCFSPSLSPDGRHIACSFSRDIYVMNADGSGLTRLTGKKGSDSDPGWSAGRGDSSLLDHIHFGTGNREYM